MNFKTQVCYAVRSSPNYKLYKIGQIIFSSVKDIAIKYGIPENTAQKYVRRGHMPCGTIIRKIIKPRTYYC
jgi:hypothetical protein